MKPVVNLKDLELRDFGNGGSFAAMLARVGARQLGAILHVVERIQGDLVW
jgi:hypothetical protein